jgi:hypothetical protein
MLKLCESRDALECVCAHLKTCKELAKFAQVRRLTRDYLLRRNEGVKHWANLALAMGCVGPYAALCKQEPPFAHGFGALPN